MKKHLLVFVIFFIFLPEYFSQSLYNDDNLITSDSCNFSDCANLVHIPDSSSWQIGNSDKPFFSDTNATITALMTDTSQTYKINDSSFFDLNFDSSHISPSYYNLLVEFDHKLETDTLLDGGYITVSFDSGAIWYNVSEFKATGGFFDNNIYFEFFDENLYTENDTLNSGIPAYTGTFDWTHSAFQMIQFPIKLASQDHLLIRFNFVSDSIDTNKDGWIIENIKTSIVKITGNVNNESLSSSQLKTYPNPVSKGYVTVELTDLQSKKAKQIYLVDYHGKLIKRFNFSSSSSSIKQLDVSGIPSGTYYLSAVGDKGVLSGYSRIIIQ